MPRTFAAHSSEGVIGKRRGMASLGRSSAVLRASTVQTEQASRIISPAAASAVYRTGMAGSH